MFYVLPGLSYTPKPAGSSNKGCRKTSTLPDEGEKAGPLHQPDFLTAALLGQESQAVVSDQRWSKGFHDNA